LHRAGAADIDKLRNVFKHWIKARRLYRRQNLAGFVAAGHFLKTRSHIPRLNL
jgi:hypothetical protein